MLTRASLLRENIGRQLANDQVHESYTNWNTSLKMATLNAHYYNAVSQQIAESELR